MTEYFIRKARIQDVKGIHALLNHYTSKGEVLARSLSELYDHLRDFFVCLEEENQAKILGTCSMHICWEDIAEIRSLAVREEYQGRQIGARLVEACLSDAVALGIYKIFVLTYKPRFFEKFGFKLVDKAILPHKVWSDCLKCAKFPDCDELAMLLAL